MRKTTRVLVGTAIAVAAVTAGVGTAATASAEKITGTTGCFNYSYGDGGVSTTVYYHNLCNHNATVIIESTCTEHSFDVGADRKGNYTLDICDVRSIRGSA